LTIKTFESAVEKDPTNEEIMSHLFMAHVRANDFKGQQQVAMKLIKQFKNNPRYIYWNVMSLVLMVHTHPFTAFE
jgi:N-terminal acetyltransferase B complex non-catalytic subunit